MFGPELPPHLAAESKEMPEEILSDYDSDYEAQAGGNILYDSPLENYDEL